MAKARKEKSRRSAPPPEPEATASNPASRLFPDLSPLAVTFLGTVVSVLIVFIWLLADSSSFSPRAYLLRQWSLGREPMVDAGQGVQFEVGTSTVLASTPVPHSGGFSVFECEIFLRDPVLPAQVILVVHSSQDPQEQPSLVDIRKQVLMTGWNPVRITADEAAALSNAQMIGLALTAKESATVMGVRNAMVRSDPVATRLGAMLGALFEWKPLSQGQNNFISSQQVAGRGIAFLLWGALPLAMALVLLRRYLLGRPFPILPHLALAVLILYLLGDLRGHVEMVRHLRSAWTINHDSKTVADYMTKHETYFPWFGEGLRVLEEKLEPAQLYYYANSDRSGGSAAHTRFHYYALPRRPANDLKQAEVSLVYQSPDVVENLLNARWTLAPSLPSGLLVFEKPKGTP